MMSYQIHIYCLIHRELRFMTAICPTNAEFVKFVLTRCGKIVTIREPLFDLTAKTGILSVQVSFLVSDGGT